MLLTDFGAEDKRGPLAYSGSSDLLNQPIGSGKQ